MVIKIVVGWSLDGSSSFHLDVRSTAIFKIPYFWFNEIFAYNSPLRIFSDVPMTWDKYHRLGDIYDYMNYLQEQYPQTAEIIDIGRSVQNRPMLLLKIGSKKFSDKPAIVIEAGKLRLSFLLSNANSSIYFLTAWRLWEGHFFKKESRRTLASCWKIVFFAFTRVNCRRHVKNLPSAI